MFEIPGSGGVHVVYTMQKTCQCSGRCVLPPHLLVVRFELRAELSNKEMAATAPRFTGRQRPPGIYTPRALFSSTVDGWWYTFLRQPLAQAQATKATKTQATKPTKTGYAMLPRTLDFISLFSSK